MADDPKRAAVEEQVPEAGPKQRRRQYRRAIYSMFAVAIFAAFVIGAVVVLGAIAPQKPDEPALPLPSPGVAKPVVYEPFYVLIIGSDTRKGTALYTGKDTEQGQVDQYADILTLMRVDPKEYKVTLVSIPRDTVVPGDKVKINSWLNSDDPEDTVQAVRRLTGIEADYYALATFESFERFIDAIGGVDVDVPQTVSVVDPLTAEKVTVQAGIGRHLDGAEALVFARARKEYPTDQDALRQVNVRTLERAIIEKVLDLGSALDAREMIDAFRDTVETDLDIDTVAALAVDFMAHKGQVRFYDATGPYDGDVRASTGQWAVFDDPDAWERIIALTDAGYDPSGVVEAPEFD